MKPLTALMLVSLLVLSGCMSEDGKSKTQLDSIETSYLPEGVLAPNSLDDVEKMRFELEELRKRTGNSTEGIAVKILIDSRIGTLEMRENLINGQLEYKLIRLNDIDCGENSAVNNTIGFFKEAWASGEKALNKLDEFNENYSGVQDITELKENLKATVSTIKQNYEEIKEYRDSVC